MTAKNLTVVVDDGTKEYTLTNKQGKTICTISFRPADFSIIDRYNAMVGELDKIVKPLEAVSIKNDGTAVFEKDWAVIKSVEQQLIDKLNELFDMDEAAAIFEKRHAFSSVGGEFFCFRVIDALGGVISAAVAEEAKLSQKRMAKYVSDISPILPPEVTTDAGATT